MYIISGLATWYWITPLGIGLSPGQNYFFNSQHSLVAYSFSCMIVCIKKMAHVLPSIELGLLMEVDAGSLTVCTICYCWAGIRL